MGTFKFRCYLSPLQMIEQDRDYRELLGPNPSLAGSQHESLAFSLTQLRQRILTHPPFWNDGYSRFGGGHIKDLELLDLVLEAAVETEIKYRKTLEAKHKESIDRIQASLERKAKEEPKAEEEDLED